MEHFPHPNFQIDEVNAQTSDSGLSIFSPIVLEVEAADSNTFSSSGSNDGLTSSYLNYARSYGYGDDSPTIHADLYEGPYPCIQSSFGPSNSSNNHADFYAQYQSPEPKLSISSEAGISNTGATLEDFEGVPSLIQIQASSNLTPLQIPEPFNQSSITDSACPSLSEGMQSPMSSQSDTPISASSGSVATPLPPTFKAPWNGLFPSQRFLDKDVVWELGNSFNIDSFDGIGTRLDAYSSARYTVSSRSGLGQVVDIDHSEFASDLIYTSNEGIRKSISCDHSKMQNAQYVHLVPFSTDFMTGDVRADSQISSDSPAAFRSQISNWSVATEKVKKCALSKRKITGQYFCKFCSADFTARHNLKNHLNSHIGFRPFPCMWCSYRSGASCTLKRHMSKKHGEVATPGKLAEFE
ncbi:hypothetical protein VKT23_006466 [Stygiomarasmius scandens]|uniref:C2H2-type domain-containing protein n=1 Tax=Marasmiellus scandens TaxID=2682957 RepID=A0ABR1JNH9_9AGAR